MPHSSFVPYVEQISSFLSEPKAACSRSDPIELQQTPLRDPPLNKRHVAFVTDLQAK